MGRLSMAATQTGLFGVSSCVVLLVIVVVFGFANLNATLGGGTYRCSDSSSGGKTEGIPVTGKWTDDRTPTFSPTTDESDDVQSQSPSLQGNRARSFRWLRPPVPNRPPFCYLLSISKCRSFWLSSVPYRHRRKPAPKRCEV